MDHIERGDAAWMGVVVFCIVALIVFNVWRDRVEGRRTRQ